MTHTINAKKTLSTLLKSNFYVNTLNKTADVSVAMGIFGVPLGAITCEDMAPNF
jgi:hypothetical protein